MKLRPVTRLHWPQSPRFKRIAVAAAILGGAALTSVSIFATGPTAEPAPRIEKAWPVSVIDARPAAQRPTFTAYGRVESQRVASIKTDLVAEVAAVHVREGDWVARGDLLLELAGAETALLVMERDAELAKHRALLRSIETEREMLERTVDQARSMNRVAQAKLTRHQELMDARLISQSLLDEVIAQANQAAIALEDHERRLADLPNRIAAQQALVSKAEALAERARLEQHKTQVTAPFAGPVLAVNVAPGDRSNLGASMVEMADAGAFEVRVQVPADYETRFQQHLAGGTAIQALLNGNQPHAGPLVLTRLANRVRPGQSGLDAFFRLDGAPGMLPPIGRVVDLSVRLPLEDDVVALPISSLYENDRVYAVEDDRLQAIRVERVGELHTREGEYRVLVRSPELEAGRRVITTQLPRAVTGLRVQAALPPASRGPSSA